MRIGLIAPPWVPVPPPAYGGTESVIANLALGLAARGHDVRLFTVGDSTSTVTRRHLYDAAAAPMGRSDLEAAHVLAAYDSFGGPDGVDVIHDHTVLGPLLGGRSGVPRAPVVTTQHNPFTPENLSILREVSPTVAVVAVSHDQASRSDGLPVAAVVHHGIDLEVHRPGRPVGEHLVFVGRMAPEKGVHRAVRIAHAVGRPLRIVTKMREQAEVAYYRDCVLPLLGSEDERPEELGLLDRLDAVGTAAALVNPIAWPEPFGLVMPEALALGTPVVAFPGGAAPEIVTHGLTGFLCPTEQDAVAAIGAIGLIDRAACRLEAERRFSLETMAARYERVYGALLMTAAGHGRDGAGAADRSNA